MFTGPPADRPHPLGGTGYVEMAAQARQRVAVDFAAQHDPGLADECRPDKARPDDPATPERVMIFHKVPPNRIRAMGGSPGTRANM
jgi:hypothetical protein